MPEQNIFAKLRARHTALLRSLPMDREIKPENITAVQEIVVDIRQAGRQVVNEDDREYLRGLLSFWGNWLYNQTRTYPNTNLEPPAHPALVEAGPPPVMEELEVKAAAGGLRARFARMGAWTVGGIVVVAVLCVAGLWFGTTRLNAASDMLPEASELEATRYEQVVEVPVEPSATLNPFPTPTALPPATALLSPAAQPSSTALPFPTPTGASANAAEEATIPPLLPVTGGGGGSQGAAGIISVQLVDPSGFFAEWAAGQAAPIRLAYINMQYGWTLFFVLQNSAGAQLVLPDSLTLTIPGQTGLELFLQSWTLTGCLDPYVASDALSLVLP